MTELYQNTIVKVINGDTQVISKITGTDYIGPNGPDAHTSTYSPGTCGWRNGGATAAAEAVKAIQSVNTVAWFSIHPNKNYLFSGSQLTQLGKLYFDNCKTVGSSQPTTNSPTEPTSIPTSTSLIETDGGYAMVVGNWPYALRTVMACITCWCLAAAGSGLS